MNQLIQHHENLSKKQLDIYQNAPNTFKLYSQLMKQKSQERENYEAPLRKEFQEHLATLEITQSNELKGQKKQYEFFLNEKDQCLGEVSDKFNQYRTKKTEQLRLCEQEIIKLFEYTEKIDVILDNVEMGVYKVEQKQGKFGRTQGVDSTAVRKGSIPDALGTNKCA
jgi:thioester reductase-like protein